MKLYDELADWWPLMSAPSEYVEESAEYMRVLEQAAGGVPRDVLELGSGGGNNASFMKARYALTLVEPAAGMRAVSQALNPECLHAAGDMRTVRLGRTFDAVFVHDAVTYMTTESDLAAALDTVAVHLRPGGVAVIAPDATAETFHPGEELGGHDGTAGRAMRWLAWTPPLPPGATSGSSHYAFMLRERDGSVRVVADEHPFGLFPRATWLRLMDQAGLPGRIEICHIDGRPYEVFAAVKA
jgi:SAM-dependent methyltransferase